MSPAMHLLQHFASQSCVYEALKKEPPIDKNFKYMNGQWCPSDKLIELYGQVSGLREIIEKSVCTYSMIFIAQFSC